MKIVFFTDYFYPEIGAAASNIYDRCKIWSKQGHEVTVITNFPNYPIGKPYDGYKNIFRKLELIDGIIVIRVGTYMTENKGRFRRTLDYLSFAFTSFLNSLTLEKPDIVISTSPHIFTPLGAISFATLKNIPHILEVRDLWPDSIAGTIGMSKKNLIYKFFQLIEKLIYRSSKQIIVFTEGFKSILKARGVNPKKMHVVINSANISIFSGLDYDENLASSLNLKNRFVVGYIGTHGLAHDLLNAVRAAAILKGENIHFLFVGEGAEKSSIISLANELNATNIHFVGMQPRERIPSYLGLCNLGLVHLKNDPVFETVIPSKIFETMTSGRPIVYCGPESDESRLVIKYSCGVVTPPNNPDLLAKKIMELKDNPDLCNLLASNGMKASQKFSRENQAKNTMNVINQVLKGKIDE